MDRRQLVTSVVASAVLGLALDPRNSVALQDEERPIFRLAGDMADPQALDPHYAVGGLDRPVVDMVFNGLVRYKPGNLAEIEPDLAESVPEPEIVDGLQTWTFSLRKGVMFHAAGDLGAYEFTADDVVYSLTKSADPDRSGFAADYSGMIVEKVDDYTVVITQDPPLSSALFLPKVANYAGGFIVSSKAVEAMGLAKFRTNPVGTGPFIFAEYNPQTSVKLAANDNYFRGAPKIGGVEVQYIPDAAARELGLRAGDIDAAIGLTEDPWVERIRAEDNLLVDIFGVGEAGFFCFDTTTAPLDDPRVREALTYTIDQDEHLALYGDAVAEDIYSIVPAQFMPGGLTMEEAEEAGVLFTRDTDHAIALLEEAGYPDGFEIDLITSEMGMYKNNYEVLQAELGDVGITINLQVVDHATMQSQIRQGVNSIVFYSAYRPNADSFLTQFFHSDSIIVTGSKPVSNFSRYDNGKVDDLIEKARRTIDTEEQEQLWKEANIQIQKDFAVFPLNNRKYVWGRQSYVDYGHEVISTAALYPQIDETTTISK